MVFRLDSAPLGKATKLANGWLRAPASLARTGVLEYLLPDGSVRRELRLPEEVFKQDSLDTFELVPLVDDHPIEGVLTAKNTALYSAGAVGKVRREGDFVVGEVLIQDARTVAKVEAGKHEISCAYHADLEMTAGVWNGQKYDCIQRNIRGNHVALVQEGRAGPDVRLRLDSVDVGVLVSNAEQTGSDSVTRDPMLKFKIDGVDFEVSEQVAQAIAKERQVAADMLSQLKGERDSAQTEVQRNAARADAADKQIADLQKQLTEAPVKIVAAVKERTELETTAREFLGAEVKLDGLSDIEVRKAVLTKLDSNLKLDSADGVYVQARFDAAISYERARNSATMEMQDRLRGAPALRTDGAQLNAEQKLYKAIASKFEAKA